MKDTRIVGVVAQETRTKKSRRQDRNDTEQLSSFPWRKLPSCAPRALLLALRRLQSSPPRGLHTGGIVIRYKETISTPYIGSLAQYRPLRPNYLQYWKLIEHCADQGIGCFEMGRSPRGSTHARFKNKWGCAEIPLPYSYRVIGPRGRYRTVSRPSAMQRLAVNVWRRLPLAVTTTLGPRLFRYVP